MSLDHRSGNLRHSQQGALAFRDFVEDVRPKLAEDLAAGPPGLDDSGSLEPGHVPRDQRLAEADRFDQIADRSRTLREPPHDSEAVHVGQRFVEDAQLPQIVGLIDDCGYRATDVGW
jgi:hypothetical protein